MPLPRKVSSLEVIRAEPLFSGMMQALNMARELSCTAKRVYLADLALASRGTGVNEASAAEVGITLGLSGEQVEYARRSLVADQLQRIVTRPSGRPSARVCLYPVELDPGPGADTNTTLAMAILLDGWLLTNRRTAPAPSGAPPRPLQVHR